MSKNNSVFKSKFILLLLGILYFGSCVNVLKLSDINTKGVTENTEKEKAKQLLADMGIAHGIDKWTGFSTYTVNISEEYYGFIGQQNNPFKNESTAASLSYIPNTNNGQIEILSGREIGTTWGVQDKQAYTIFNDDIKETVDASIRYWVPNYQFIIEFPKRIQEANSISYNGQDTINGEICEGVIATWNTIKPQKEIDQYLIWINVENQRIAKLEYTKRAINKYAIETAYFNNYNDYDGIILPSEILVESNLVKKGLLHKMSIFSFKKDYMHITSLAPLQDEEEEY